MHARCAQHQLTNGSVEAEQGGLNLRATSTFFGAQVRLRARATFERVARESSGSGVAGSYITFFLLAFWPRFSTFDFALPAAELGLMIRSVDRGRSSARKPLPSTRGFRNAGR